MTLRLLILASVAALCAACTSSVGGVAAPDATTPKLPPRPREIRIAGIDPCKTLSSPQLASLQVRYSTTDEALNKRGPGCQWVHSPYEPVEAYTVAINTDGGVELAFGQPELQVIAIAGFGAVQTPGLYSSGKNDCIVEVDVAPLQAVQVGYFYNGSTVPMNHEIACQKARNAAELVMQTILARAGG